MSAPTPGPWKVVVEKQHPLEPAVMAGNRFVATCHDEAGGDRLANARLIAAAPDLLDACETLLVELVQSVPPEQESHRVNTVRAAVIVAARKAIKNARGGK